MNKLLLFLAFFLASGIVIASENPDRLIQEGNALYKIAKYENAAEKYNQIVMAGFESPTLYYNLANSYYRLNDIPNAILYYERALRLSPTDSDIKINLQVANSKIEDKIDAIPPVFLFRWIQSLSNLFNPGAWGVLCILFTLLCSISAFSYFYSTSFSMKKNTFYSSLLFLFLIIVTFSLGNSRYNKIHNKKEAIIFQEIVPVKNSPENTAAEKFVLHPGTKVFIKEKSNNWYRISLANGHVGWIEKESVQII